MKNFKLIEADFDFETSERYIFGRFTKKRRKIVESFVRRYNSRNKYLYGDKYTCGCLHDCCGCITSNKLFIEFNNNFIKITSTKTYNY